MIKIHYRDIEKSILDVKEDKLTFAMNWGRDNAFPSLMEMLLRLSPTASSCLKKVSQNIYGKAFGELGRIKINKDGDTLNDILKSASRELAKFNNVFFWVNYNAAQEINQIKVIPCSMMRRGRLDSNNYSGLYLKYDNFDKKKGKIDADSILKINTYTEREEILLSQIEKCKGIENFNGHILHVRTDVNMVYAPSRFEEVIFDMYTERKCIEGRKNSAERGFFNSKTIFVPKFRDDDDAIRFSHTIKGSTGLENAGQIKVIELDTNEITDQNLKVVDTADAPDFDTIKGVEDQCKESIIVKSGVPTCLISQNENGLFGNSGETLKAAKSMLWEDLTEEREYITDALVKLLERSVFSKKININELEIQKHFNYENNNLTTNQDE